MAEGNPPHDNDQPPSLEQILGGPHNVDVFFLLCAWAVQTGLLIMKKERAQDGFGYNYRLYAKIFGIRVFLCFVNEVEMPEHSGPSF